MPHPERPELVSPAGDLRKLRFALRYGADAVYVGTKRFSLRAQSGNFTLDELAAGVAEAHALGKKVYLTANTYLRDNELPELEALFREAAPIGLDGVICADVGAMSLARERMPDVPLHISTQANTSNARTVKVWRELGASRVVLARELSFDEIKRIRDATDVSLEIFVHGAMCMALSGRCLLSSYFTSPVHTIGGKRRGVRDANRGDCVQSCRWNFVLSESERPGEYFPVEETPDGTTILSSKDLCLAHRMRELVEAGIDAFKIEGRMKGVYYVSNVTRVYRRALDDALAGRDTPPEILAELEQVSHREYATGFLFGEAAALEPHLRGAYIRDRLWVGTVQGKAGQGRTKILTANRLRKGDRIEAIRPDGTNLAIPDFRIYREGVEIEMTGHDTEVELEFPGAEALREFDILRGEITEN